MKPRDQGTRWESAIVEAAEEWGCKAYRLAPSGTKDLADILIETPNGDTFLVSAKDRQQLNIHAELGKLLGRVDKADLGCAVAGVGVAWKRMVPGEGVRRVRAGPPLVAVSLNEWLALITGR